MMEIIEFHEYKISGNPLTNIYTKSWWYEYILYSKVNFMDQLFQWSQQWQWSSLSSSPHFVGWRDHTQQLDTIHNNNIITLMRIYNKTVERGSNHGMDILCKFYELSHVVRDIHLFIWSTKRWCAATPPVRYRKFCCRAILYRTVAHIRETIYTKYF